MQINLILHQNQIEKLINIIDQHVNLINSGYKDSLGISVDEYINLAHDLEESLDEIYT